MARDRRLYDRISTTYTETRRADPRVAAPIHEALGDARTVLNVGAGTGNYEPTDRTVVALEPSTAMLAKRDPRGVVIQGVAEALPVRSASFDAAMASLTIHHWGDLDAGLRELARVADRQVIFMYDPTEVARFWAIEYFAEAMSVPSEADAPTPDRVAEVLRVVDVRPVPVPFDCTDGFGAAFWGRPEAYLDPDVQAGQSWLAQLPADVRNRCADHLADDLRSGAWDERFGHLRALDELDTGYRLVVAEGLRP